MAGLAGIGLIALLTIGIIFSRLYKRSTKETSFVRTGLGGQKVIMDGGAILLPVFHERVLVNMNTLKLEVVRRERESLITKDRMRVDVTAAFFVRVKQTEDIVKMGDEIWVKCLGLDEKGRVKRSRKAAMAERDKESGGGKEAEAAPAPAPAGR